MSDVIQSSATTEQTTIWVRSLIALAWADGHFDPIEQEIITELLHENLTEAEKVTALEPIADADLARVLGRDAHLAENFLRTAVMVALADGDYSEKEDALLMHYCQVLNQKPEAIQVLRHTFQSLAAAQPGADDLPGTMASPLTPPALDGQQLVDGQHPDVLHPVREWLDTMEVQDPKVARMLCKLIPSQCPFERDITLFGRQLVHIPPLCKINPLYEQLVGLRFRALSYLADDCGEDVTPYI
ncbi:MAG: Mo-dependent nitrogenase C-terminal domain-containing protein [Leptolyngbyaceae cyanobacterium bins.349]|nr:Mo-dependent nitrogenase C-terminal domain-containing protein [Leptolyngbyaceae cyanobacterium bins.349]